jgi:mono/diheme cytochrome c family protein
MPSLSPVRRTAVTSALALALVAGGTSMAAAAPTAKPKPTPVTVAAGRVIFKANCTVCHTLADAKSHGTLGPNLDKLKPSMKLVIHQVTNGGGSMPAFGGQLSKTKIEAVAKYVSTVAGKVKSTSSSSGAGGLP